MNFAGFEPTEFTRWSSLVERDDATVLPNGLLTVARNNRYKLTSTRIRDGVQKQFASPNQQPITGLASLKYLSTDGTPDVEIPLGFDMAGELFVERPSGSGNVVPIVSTQVVPPSNIHMNTTPAYNRAYMAFTDQKTGQYNPAVLDLKTGNLDPLGQKLVGQRWTELTTFQVGEVVTPSVPVQGNSHTYICTVAGTTANVEPVWPLTTSGVITDGSCTWTEQTMVLADQIPTPSVPIVARNLGAGAFAVGRDVYIAVTLVNGVGETVMSVSFKFVNTLLNDQFVVTSPVLTAWITALIAPYAVTGYNVYEADVATTAAAPISSAYRQVNVGVVAIGVPQNVNTTGLGAAPPAATTARITGAGNICSGQRFAVVLFMNRNDMICGMTEASVIPFNADVNGFGIYVANLPIGPAPSTAKRIIAFTVAIAPGSTVPPTTAGPYFYIPKDDNVNGTPITKTVVADNVTTTATFTFTDQYLLASTEVTGFFNKIAPVPVTDIYFSQTLNRLIYTGALGFPSGHMISLQNDPESIYGNTGILQVAQTDGQHTVVARELNGTLYSLKERSGYLIQQSNTDPWTWTPVKKWDKVGPCGPRAVDVLDPLFLAFVHRSGLYLWDGSTLSISISKELAISWKLINWTYQHLIWLHIDDQEKVIRIGVPLRDSAVPDTVLVLDYTESITFSAPIHFSPIAGREIATGECYKWSMDTGGAGAAFLAVRTQRTLPPSVNSGFDQVYPTSQLLLASSNADGMVNASVPGAGSDNGVGIDWEVQTVSPGDMLPVRQLGGAKISATGKGSLYVSVISGRTGKEIKLKEMKLNESDNATYSCGARGYSEQFRLRMHNNKQVDFVPEIKTAIIYSKPTFSSR